MMQPYYGISRSEWEEQVLRSALAQLTERRDAEVEYTLAELERRCANVHNLNESVNVRGGLLQEYVWLAGRLIETTYENYHSDVEGVFQ